MNSHTDTRGRAFAQGARDTVPLIFAAIPFGVVFGALALANGLSREATLAMSMLVFAGSSQFIAVTLLASAAAMPVILLTVFIVNLRQMLYSASLMPHVKAWPQRLRLLSSYFLTDETYAVVANHVMSKPGDQRLPWYYMGSALSMYGNWVLCTYVGMTLGQQIPDLTAWGLDIAMVVAFIGIVVPLLHSLPRVCCALVAGIGSVVCYEWPNQMGLLFSSLLAIAVGLLLERVSSAREVANV
jgi:4-azaleucine resistance transporter AzlC